MSSVKTIWCPQVYTVLDDNNSLHSPLRTDIIVDDFKQLTLVDIFWHRFNTAYTHQKRCEAISPVWHKSNATSFLLDNDGLAYHISYIVSTHKSGHQLVGLTFALTHGLKVVCEKLQRNSKLRTGVYKTKDTSFFTTQRAFSKSRTLSPFTRLTYMPAGVSCEINNFMSQQ